MKLLALLFLAGIAVVSATPLHPSNYEVEVESSLNEFISSAALADEGDGFDVEKLKEKFNELLKKVKDAFENGINLKDALDKLQQIRQKLKDLHVDLGENGREYLEKFKEKVKEYWNKLKEKLTSKRADDFYVKLQKLKEMLEQGVDAAGLKSLVEDMFGNGTSNEFTEHFFTLLDEGPSGRQKLLEWIERVVGEKED